MRDFLEAEGFGVVTAHNSREAFAVLDRTSLDCLVLDVMMPGQTGFDLCRQAYALYEAFRPTVPEGEKGWGAQGELDLGHIRSLAK